MCRCFRTRIYTGTKCNKRGAIKCSLLSDKTRGRCSTLDVHQICGLTHEPQQDKAFKRHVRRCRCISFTHCFSCNDHPQKCEIYNHDCDFTRISCVICFFFFWSVRNMQKCRIFFFETRVYLDYTTTCVVS